MDNDKFFIKRAVEIARQGIIKGGGPFGAVVVKDNKIISEAFNRVVLDRDPTAHAEILAIRKASVVLKSHHITNCTIYASCEPCPMCLGAIYWAGIKKVIYASDRSDAEKAGFSDKMIYEEILLDPENRKIRFVLMHNTGGSELFREWAELENKIPY